MDTPIAFECVAPSHLSAAGPDNLTVHQRQWAFCPYDTKAKGHDWRATGGVPLAMLRQAARLRAKPRQKSVR